MPPWKENKKQFAENVRRRDVEVVFQRWQRDVTVYLRLLISRAFILQGLGLLSRFAPRTPARPSLRFGPSENPSGRCGRS